MRRDFTYIDDIVEAFDRSAPNPASSWAPHRLFNIGNAQSEELLDFISLLERALGRESSKQFEPLQPGDVEATAADTTPLAEGVERFATWYRTSAGTTVST